MPILFFCESITVFLLRKCLSIAAAILKDNPYRVSALGTITTTEKESIIFCNEDFMVFFFFLYSPVPVLANNTLVT